MVDSVDFRAPGGLVHVCMDNRRVVRRHWVGSPNAWAKDEIRLDAVRGEVVRDADSPFGRKVEVVRNPPSP